jgi:hypothetical protein
MATRECLPRLTAIGISYPDALALRRIAMTLHRWHELECGIGNGFLERDEKTNRPFWNSAYTRRMATIRRYVPDRELPALKRLAVIMGNYPKLRFYVQGDPRGASLYILRPGDVPEGEDVDAYYSRGIAVYK